MYCVSKDRLTVLITILMVFFILGTPAWAQEKPKSDKRKAIILVIDAVSWDDIRSANTPHLKALISDGHVGLMNTKTKGWNRVNSASGYFSMGIGMRANIPEASGQLVNSLPDGKLQVQNIDELRTLLEEDLPNYTAGQFGATAREMGLKIALVGNADTLVKHRETALIAMDEEGVIPYGYVGTKLLIEDKKFPGRYRTNEKVLLKEIEKVLPKADAIFVDFGDTARINEFYNEISNVNAEKSTALTRVDQVIGKLLGMVDKKNTMVMVVVPNASETSIAKGNTSLTPLVIYNGLGQGGLVISNTTKREGLVSNIDFAPTVFKYLKGQKGKFFGEPISYRPVDGEKDNLTAVEKKERKLFNLRWGRFITHGFYVTLMVLAMGFSFIPKLATFFRVSEATRFKLCTITLTYPLTVFLIGPLLPYRHFILETITILLIAFVLNHLLVNWLEKRSHFVMVVTLSTSVLMLLYLYFAPSFLLNSPLGFDDVFLGGRYYGINNDSMGILLGAMAMGLFTLYQWFNLPDWVKKILVITVCVIAVIAHTPAFGANVGGTITAMAITVFTALVLFTRGPLSWQKVLLVVGLVFAVELVIAYFDSLFDPPTTHAGKAIKSLYTTGFATKFTELLLSKLRLFGLMMIIPPYNLIMAGELLIFTRMLRGSEPGIHNFKEGLPALYDCMKIIFFGGLVAFFFNDTGVIATAMMYTYFILPYAILTKK